MREFFSDKNFLSSKILVAAKIIFITALIIFFIPLLILPFYNHPFADDYYCGYNLAANGFKVYQTFIYKNWGGRFAATFTGSLFANHDFLYSHYYLFSLLLLLMDAASTFFLISIVCKHVLKIQYAISKRLLGMFLFVALEICSVPQVSTFIFWFSSAITYHLPVILTEIEIALFIILYNSANRFKKSCCAILLPLLVFVIAGFNELFIIAQLFLFVIIIWLKLYKKLSFIFCLVALIAGSALVLFAPGNEIRAHGIENKNFFAGVAATAYHATGTLWFIFKNPLFWLIAVLIFVYTYSIKQRLQAALLLHKLYSVKWQFLFYVFIFLIAVTALPVAALKGGIIPDRYVNAVVCFMLMLLLIYSFISGISFRSAIVFTLTETKKSIAYFLLAIGLLSNDYIIDAYKSLIIAPVYNTVLNERESALKLASTTTKIAAVKTYDVALSDLLKTKFSSASVTYQNLIKQKPPLVFFEDDLATKYSVDILKKYYRLDSVIIK